MRTGYGVATVNLTAALSKLFTVTLTPRSPPQEEEVLFNPAVKEALERGRTGFDYNTPSINIWHASGLQSFTGKQRIGFPIFEGTIFKPEEVNHLINLDAIFVTSRWAARILSENIEQRLVPPIFPVGLGYDPSVFFAAKTQGIQGISQFPGPRGVNIGKWEVRKGHLDLIRVLSRLRPAMTLFCAWDNPFFPGWKQLCVQKLQDNGWQEMESTAHWRAGDCHLVLTSWVETHMNYAELLRSVDFCIFPYRAEGWCLPLIEAMACGVPYIATFYSAPKEYLEPTDDTPRGGLLLCEGKMQPIFDQVHFPNGGYGDWFVPNEEDMAQAITYLLNSDMKELGKMAAAQVAEFTWDHSAAKIAMALDLLNG